MAPKKPTKDQLLALLEGGSGPMPTVEPLKASEIVTYPALTGILSTLEERHNGLVALMNQRFSTLERMSQDRSEQLVKAETAINARITEEVKRNDTRYGWVMGIIGTAVLAEIIRFFVLKT